MKDEKEIYPEIIHPLPENAHYKAALFDFDGTLSLIRSGWQEVMIPYFKEEFYSSLPNCDMSDEEVTFLITDFVDKLTGKQTIFQCLQLKIEIENRGGKAKDEMEYKTEYLRRLNLKIKDKKEGLENGKVNRLDMLVCGSEEVLALLKEAGISLYCASGTDQPQVREEARLLGLDRFFGENIFGALDEHARQCSKELVIKRLMEENGIHGCEMLAFGDGFVEIEEVHKAGGYCVGVATNEANQNGIDTHKRERLIEAGAGMIIPHFGEYKKIFDRLIANK